MSWWRPGGRRAADRRREEEFEAHVALYAEELIARGRTPDEARREARVAFGNLRAHREEVADMSRLPLMDALGRDLGYAVRILRRSPAFALTAIGTLAVVIGANSAVFSLADSILLRPLPYPAADQLAEVEASIHGPKGQDLDDSVDGWEWEAVRDQVTTVDAAAYVGSSGANVVTGESAAYIDQQRVAAGFFRVLGVRPLLGREFTATEDSAGGPAVTVLSYGMWQRFLHGRPDAVGQTLLLKGEPHTIVGVMPQGFVSTAKADVWTPLRASHRGEGAGNNFGMIARVKPGVSWAAANTDLARLSPAATAHNIDPSSMTATLLLVPLQAAMTADDQDPLRMLTVAVVAVLVIACVNIAALLLSRGGSRAKEIATRMALGSGRAAVVRQLLVESLVLALVGGALGLVVGAGALATLKALGGETFSSWGRASMDARVVATMAGLSVVTSLCFGLVPAWQASRLDINATLLGGGSRSVAGSARRWPRRLLVVAEVTLGVALLVTTGLLLRTFVKLRELDPGFNPTSVVTATASLQDARYQTSAAVNRLFDATFNELGRDPGVASAGVALCLPFERLLNMGFYFTDQGQQSATITNVAYVAGDYFHALQIPVRAGRALSPADRAGTARVVVVNDTFVRMRSAHQPVLGRRVTFGHEPDREIVGVVGDVLQTSSGFSVPGASGPLRVTPTIYLPASQASDGFMAIHVWFSPAWVVRARTVPDGEAALRHALSAADPLLPVATLEPMTDVMTAAIGDRRLLMTIVAALTVVALFLSALGIHGLVAQQVAERTREFGIRVALGATPAETVRQVALGSLALSAVGVIAGLGVSLLAAGFVKSFLWHVTTADPLTYAGAAIFLLLMTVAAALLPALRLLRLNPAATLRD